MTALGAGYDPATGASPWPSTCYQKKIKSGATIYRNAVVALNTSGTWEPASADSSLIVYGFARLEKQADSVTGDGTKELKVDTGCKLLVGSGLTAADEGKTVYTVDDATFSLSSNSGARPVKGKLMKVVDSTHGYVAIDPIFSELSSGATINAGAALTDADATVQITGAEWRTLPAATLTAARTLTLGTTGAVAGDRITVTRLDVTGFSYAIANGGAGAGTLLTFPGGEVGSATFRFDGTNWTLFSAGNVDEDWTIGTALTDASTTIQRGGRKSWRTLPATTLSTNRTLTLGTTGATKGDEILITRIDASANTYAIANGGAGAGTLVTMPASKINHARCYFDGTNWLLMSCGVQ